MKVYLVEDIHPDAYELLKQNHDVINNEDRLNEVDVIISRNLHLDESFLKQCSNLKLIVVHGTGVDGVDFEYTNKRKIDVMNVPGQNALAVAELNITYALMLLRKINLVNHHLHDKVNMTVGDECYMGHELSYKKVGFIGYGHIARETINILKHGFHCQCLVYSPSLTKEQALKDQIVFCPTINDVFHQSDIIYVCCSLNEQTRNLINKSYFDECLPHCLLINNARGAIVNEQDLYQTLIEHKLSGAAMDVFEHEPPHQTTHPLLSLPQFIASPHIGAMSDEAMKRVGMACVLKINQYFN